MGRHTECYPKRSTASITIEIFKRLYVIASESSNAWNNAGIAHSALCELNYTLIKLAA